VITDRDRIPDQKKDPIMCKHALHIYKFPFFTLACKVWFQKITFNTHPLPLPKDDYWKFQGGGVSRTKCVKDKYEQEIGIPRGMEGGVWQFSEVTQSQLCDYRYFQSH